MSNPSGYCAKLLIVDDDEEDYIIARDILSDIEDWEFDVSWVSEYDAALKAIGTGQFDACLVDYHLGPKKGLDLLVEVLSSGSKTPLILLTGLNDREVDIKAMEAGAADYLVKGRIDPFLLERSIRYSIQRRQEQESKELLEQQLLQSQKIESVGRLAGGVAHELNNLLTPIMGYAQILLTRPNIDKEQRNNLEQINRASSRASDLVKQLLTFSHRGIVEPKIIQLNELIADVTSMLRRLIDEDIELVVVLDPAAKPVKADPRQLEQLLVNLTVNARDAMPSGGKLTIETQAVVRKEEGTTRDDSEHYVMLTVTDDGVGMSEETLEHIFEPFFTTKELGKGTGLGLATCYGIINQLGGEIDVYSRPETGTKFTVCVPIVEGEATSLESFEPQMDPPSGSETILVVEDEPSVRSLTSTILKEMGYTVLEANNGEEALRIAEQNPSTQIHLLISDIVMPRMGGVELAKNYLSLYPAAAVLLMSGYNDEVTGNESVLDDRIDFLAKPFTPVALAQKTRHLLDLRSSRAMTATG